ncbi:unnamed protein product, partial [Urochloa humidicola]
SPSLVTVVGRGGPSPAAPHGATADRAAAEELEAGRCGGAGANRASSSSSRPAAVSMSSLLPRRAAARSRAVRLISRRPLLSGEKGRPLPTPALFLRPAVVALLRRIGRAANSGGCRSSRAAGLVLLQRRAASSSSGGRLLPPPAGEASSGGPFHPTVAGAAALSSRRGTAGSGSRTGSTPYATSSQTSPRWARHPSSRMPSSTSCSYGSSRTSCSASSHSLISPWACTTRHHLIICTPCVLNFIK